MTAQEGVAKLPNMSNDEQMHMHAQVTATRSIALARRCLSPLHGCGQVVMKHGPCAGSDGGQGCRGNTPSSATCSMLRLLSRAFSMDSAQGLVEGKAAEGTPIICDVRDVACAHVAAAERPSASGRYIVSQRAPITPSFVSQTLRVCRPCALSLTIQDAILIHCASTLKAETWCATYEQFIA